MISFKEAFDLLGAFPHRTKTRIGGALVILLTLVFAYQARFIPSSALALLNVQIDSGWLIVIWLVLWVAVACVAWLIWSGRLLWRRGDQRVVIFCIEHKNPRIHSYYVQSLDLLRSFIAQCGLSDEIIIQDIGWDVITSDSDAQRYTLRRNVVAVFHGRLFLDQEGGNFIHHYNFRVTWRNPPQISSEIAKLLEVDSNLFCSNRDWNIREVDSKNDQHRVAGAFREIVLFLVVVSQLTDQQTTAKNIEILEKLSRLIREENEGLTVTLKSGETVPKEAMPILRQARVNALLRDLYLDYAGIRIREQDHKTAKQLLVNALKIPSDKERRIGVLVPLAVSCYHLGDIAGAKQYSQEIGDISNANPHFLVNLGFLEIVEQNYDKSLTYYKRFVLGEMQHESLVSQVVEFLSQRLSESPTEAAFKFAIGVINFAYFDHDQGAKDLSEFANSVQEEMKYRQMVAFANQLLTRGLEGTRRYLQKQSRRKAAKRK